MSDWKFHKQPETPESEKYREFARSFFLTPFAVIVAPDAPLSKDPTEVMTKPGRWVQTWVWVSTEEAMAYQREEPIEWHTRMLDDRASAPHFEDRPPPTGSEPGDICFVDVTQHWHMWDGARWRDWGSEEKVAAYLERERAHWLQGYKDLLRKAGVWKDEQEREK
jgi:hypothetical protein